LNNNLAYIYFTDSNINGSVFQVIKIDFSSDPPNYFTNSLTMASGSSLSVNTIVSTSIKNANDFYFAGKTKSLTDGRITKNFSSEVGFVMKPIITNQNETCFSFSSGFSL